ncbi:hypothetical protein L1987_78223 [Smallanthus sonchifolius]|uniref:Uncharacterized protein n=1 Tax=Smallanthus sonchifolius TaxID=185202 RepID=A0ACB8ZD51_9ASTR|nr:hypothetical protein L1987_78223 [Smallanthus sonchifolius]
MKDPLTICRGYLTRVNCKPYSFPLSSKSSRLPLSYTQQQPSPSPSSSSSSVFFNDYTTRVVKPITLLLNPICYFPLFLFFSAIAALQPFLLSPPGFSSPFTIAIDAHCLIQIKAVYIHQSWRSSGKGQSLHLTNKLK